MITIFTLSGQITNQRDQPMEGLLVRLFEKERRDPAKPLGNESITDSEGRYFIYFSKQALPDGGLNQRQLKFTIKVYVGNEVVAENPVEPSEQPQNTLDLKVDVADFPRLDWSIQGQVIEQSVSDFSNLRVVAVDKNIGGLGSPSYTYLQAVTETHPRKIQTLTEILEDLGVYDLLRDVSESSQVAMLSSIPLDPYEARLLREAGHPKPAKSGQEYLRLAARDPKLLSLADEKLEEAGQISLSVHGDINTIINIQQEPPDNPSALPANPTAKKPKKRKLFTGLGTLFSGVVLVSGNALMISTVPFAR